MTELRRLNKRIVSVGDDFLVHSDPCSVYAIDDSSVSSPIPGASFDRKAVDQLFRKAISSNSGQSSSSLDKSLTVPFHREVSLRRDVAADTLMWSWMGVCVFPFFIKYRWQDSGGKVTLNRYEGPLVKQCLSRMWWLAELTCDPSQTDPTLKYALTEKALSLPGFQQVNEDVFGRNFCAVRDAVDAFITVVASEPEKTMQQVVTDFQCLLTTMPLELLDGKQIRAELSELLKDVKTRS